MRGPLHHTHELERLCGERLGLVPAIQVRAPGRIDAMAEERHDARQGRHVKEGHAWDDRIVRAHGRAHAYLEPLPARTVVSDAA